MNRRINLISVALFIGGVVGNDAAIVCYNFGMKDALTLLGTGIACGLLATSIYVRYRTNRDRRYTAATH